MVRPNEAIVKSTLRLRQTPAVTASASTMVSTTVAISGSTLAADSEIASPATTDGHVRAISVWRITFEGHRTVKGVPCWDALPYAARRARDIRCRQAIEHVRAVAARAANVLLQAG